MFLNIPKLKTELTVRFDINVPIYCESRNLDFLFKRNLIQDKNCYSYKVCNRCNIEYCYSKCPNCNSYGLDNLAVRQVLLPGGARLFIDRYYIRNGAEEFDSITFRYHFRNEKSRFWLKLEDACLIEFE